MQSVLAVIQCSRERDECISQGFLLMVIAEQQQQLNQIDRSTELANQFAANTDEVVLFLDRNRLLVGCYWHRVQKVCTRSTSSSSHQNLPK